MEWKECIMNETFSDSLGLTVIDFDGTKSIPAEQCSTKI